MQQRLGTATKWTEVNPILATGELGFEVDTNKFKIGNGTSTWSQLPYYINQNDIPEIQPLIDAAIEEVQTLVQNSVSTAIAGLVDSAPAALDTLNELAAAIADDSTFANTITNALANKADENHTHPAADIISAVVPVTAITYSIQQSDAGKILSLSPSGGSVSITVNDVLTPGQSISFFLQGTSASISAGTGQLQTAISSVSTQYSMFKIICVSSGFYTVSSGA